MPVPKRRRSRMQRDTRRANHDRMTAPPIEPCPNCGEPRQQHRVCPSCGTYKGVQVLPPKKDRQKKEGGE